MEELLDIDELCSKLKLNKSWVYQRTKNNSIPCVRFGKYLRFRLSDVVAYFEKGESNGEPNVPNDPDTERGGQPDERKSDF